MVKNFVEKSLGTLFNDKMYRKCLEHHGSFEQYDASIDALKRAETGSFYTPKRIRDYHVAMMLEKYEYNASHRFLDPSVGSGNYVLAFLEGMMQKGIDPLYLVMKQLTIVDIELESLMIACIHIAEFLEEKCGDLVEDVFIHAVCDNFLTSDQLEEHEFALVFTNPPYVGEKGNRAIFDPIKASPFGKKYYQGKMDCYGYFFYKGMELLAEGGRLSFIIPSYFLMSDSAKLLRQKMHREYHIESLDDFNDVKVFPNAQGIHSLIITLSKESTDAKTVIRYLPDALSKKVFEASPIEKQMIVQEIRQSALMINGNFVIKGDGQTRQLLQWVTKKQFDTLDTICHVNQGFVTGCDRLSKKDLKALSLGEEQSVFVIKEEERKKFQDHERLKPLIKNSQLTDVVLKRWEVNYNVIYNDSDACSEEYISYLRPFKEVLERRREVRNGVRAWYALTWPRQQSIFEGEKIMAPQRALKPIFCYDNSVVYGSADIYYITLKVTLINTWSLQALTAYLYSSFVTKWLTVVGKRKGNMFELYATPLKGIPILNLPDDGIRELKRAMLDYRDEESTLEKMQARVDAIIIEHYPELKIKHMEA